MDLVIDANILFAALIKEGTTIELIFNENIHLFAPEFLLKEFAKYKEEILRKTKRTEEQLNEILEILNIIITIIPKEEFKEFFKEAEQICPDPKDIDYFALALKLRSAIWSNDKDIRDQSRIKIYSTKELIEFYG